MKTDEPTKTCSTCQQKKPSSEFHRRRHTVKCGYRAACKDCTREAMRKHPKKPKTEEIRHKDRVRAMTQLALEQGKIHPQPCAVCGGPQVHAHHLSYDGENAHLEVVWLCIEHHRREHGKRAWT